MEKEVRTIQNLIRRTNNESRMVEGTAIVFNSLSQDMGVFESIDPAAVDADTIAQSDIFAYLNHDESRGVLARSRYGHGSLTLSLQDDGLHYSFIAPETALGDELLSYLSRGEITTSSFAFTVADDGDVWEKKSDGNIYRTITKIDRLYDVSPVFEPAYLASSCAKRKLEELNIKEKLKALKEKVKLL